MWSRLDPEILRRIRAMEHRDIPRVAELHHAAMGSSLWAQLGLPFLRSLYSALIEHPAFLGFVYEEELAPRGGRVRGFIAGTSDGERLLSETFRRQPLLLLLAAGRGVLRKPWLGLRLAQTPLYFQRSGSEGAQPPGESMFCSFEPELRGRRIAGHANKVLFDELLARGHDRVKVTTDADNEAAARQLLSWEFEEQGDFSFYGKPMRLWIMDLKRNTRLEPVSRHRAV